MPVPHSKHHSVLQGPKPAVLGPMWDQWWRPCTLVIRVALNSCRHDSWAAILSWQYLHHIHLGNTNKERWSYSKGENIPPDCLVSITQNSHRNVLALWSSYAAVHQKRLSSCTVPHGPCESRGLLESSGSMLAQQAFPPQLALLPPSPPAGPSCPVKWYGPLPRWFQSASMMAQDYPLCLKRPRHHLVLQERTPFFCVFVVCVYIYNSAYLYM